MSKSHPKIETLFNDLAKAKKGPQYRVDETGMVSFNHGGNDFFIQSCVHNPWLRFMCIVGEVSNLKDSSTFNRVLLNWNFELNLTKGLSLSINPSDNKIILYFGCLVDHLRSSRDLDSLTNYFISEAHHVVQDVEKRKATATEKRRSTSLERRPRFDRQISF